MPYKLKPLKKKYNEKFGSDKPRYFSAPGRTEIIGNHTDHNHGRVIAAAINLNSVAAAAPNGTKEIMLFSEGYPEYFKISLNDLSPLNAEKGSSAALMRGIASYLKGGGYEVSGFNAVVKSGVLPGSGLSSSASFEVLIGRIISGLFNGGKISNPELALAGQYAENKYFGKPCGLMDQLTCAEGGVVSIDFLNPAEPELEKFQFDPEEYGYQLCIVNTGGSHANLTEEYAEILNEMREIAAFFSAEYLREVEEKEFLSSISGLRKKAGDRAVLRAMHFFGENRRVLRMISAIKENDINLFLDLINESGRSSENLLQNIFPPGAGKEQPLALALAMTKDFIHQAGAGACRVHGGGFAGTIQAFIPKTAEEDYLKIVSPVFGKNNILRLQFQQRGTDEILM
jgi:galactokinase